jgi:NAD(P)-dependent dehydrogenase (short-subunit alcohol dehydrogenase family)
MSAKQDDMTGRVCLVTGANAGIGKATARGLAAAGAEVLIVCRSRERGSAARDEIIAETGNAQVSVWVADLARQDDIRQLAAAIQEQFPALHVLINNAAIIPQKWMESPDGYELQFAVNHLAPFLFTNLLLDQLKTGAPARIITVSSQTHSGMRIPFDDLQSLYSTYHPSRTYAWTKLANILFTYELARRLAGTGVTANTLHPGVVNTNLLYDYMGRPRTTRQRSGASGLSAEEGAVTSLYLACSPEVATVTGSYFRDQRAVKSSPASYDRAAARQLWAISAELTRLQ